ncbi:hypothetical protein [Streptomyces sp. PSKA30]|uniref:hypothetical protein n=1 Tax=Streptomyces sp. PSKA30 TaxID=2874597 RepID=UPI001CD14CF9|nr:hypothetical protein [Streptomyces sp. PSKA30]MBZ9641182.1 hypothetical protein [Streptomyces sp. PSKA30]
MPEVFSAHTARMRQATSNIEQFIEAADGIVDHFRTVIAPSRPWPGQNDEFARQLRPGEIDEWETAINTCNSLAQAVAAIARGVMANLADFQGTQEGAIDAINEQSNRHNGPGRR